MFSALAPFVFILLNPQTNALPCEASARTLRLLESLECLEDRGIPYERRMSPLRALAEKNPNDFFIQHFYQDAFRREFYLADEYDHALALYLKSPDSWLSRYFEARLLLGDLGDNAIWIECRPSGNYNRENHRSAFAPASTGDHTTHIKLEMGPEETAPYTTDMLFFDVVTSRKGTCCGGEAMQFAKKWSRSTQ